jgi:cytochrome c biogenesis protein CcdA
MQHVLHHGCMAGCRPARSRIPGQSPPPPNTQRHRRCRLRLPAKPRNPPPATSASLTLRTPPPTTQALTPLTIGRNRFAASFLGSLWGLGHSTGQLLLAIAFSFLKDQFTSLLPFLERWASTIVGLTLVAIGALGVYETFFEAHDADASVDEEKLRELTDRSAHPGRSESRIAAATFATGILYGLQPDALFVIIPALALPTHAAAFAFCAMFVIGTVLAMGGYTLFIGTASEELCKGRPGMQRKLSVAASAIAVAVGVALILPSFGVDVPLFH